MITLENIPLPEIRLVYTTRMKASERPMLTSSKDAYELLNANWDHNLIEIQEQSKVLFLNRSNKVLGIFTASSGGITGTVVDPKLVMMAVINSGATQIMLAHNHPSGNLKPSRHDEELTMKLKNAAAFFDIKVLDHIIITKEAYYSFADEGLL